MSDRAAHVWFVAGTVPLIAAGALHAVAALVDTVRPTFFAPMDPAAMSPMESTGIRLRRMAPHRDAARPSVWQVWLGIHISHGVAVATFGILCLLIATHDFALVTGIAALRPITIAFSATYFVLSLRFWFYGPALITGTSLLCFSVAAALTA